MLVNYTIGLGSPEYYLASHQIEDKRRSLFFSVVFPTSFLWHMRQNQLVCTTRKSGTSLCRTATCTATAEHTLFWLTSLACCHACCFLHASSEDGVNHVSHLTLAFVDASTHNTSVVVCYHCTAMLTGLSLRRWREAQDWQDCRAVCVRQLQQGAGREGGGR